MAGLNVATVIAAHIKLLSGAGRLLDQPFAMPADFTSKPGTPLAPPTSSDLILPPVPPTVLTLIPKSHVSEAFHLEGRTRNRDQLTYQLVKSPKAHVLGEVIAMEREAPMVATAARPITIESQNKPRSIFPR